MLTPAVLRELFPHGMPPLLTAIAAQQEEVFARFEIGADGDRLHFLLAQIGHETDGLTRVEENLNYSAQRLCAVWPRRFPSLGAAAECAGNPEKLGDMVYGGRMGNQPAGSGDGFRYRGRGLLQLTGRDGYAQVGRVAAIDLVGQPELAAAPDTALVAACAFWSWKGLNTIADTGDFTAATRRINGGVTGLPERKAWLDKVRRVLSAPPPPVLPPLSTIIAVQKALRAAGFDQIGAADGVLGQRSMAAILQYRRQHGLGDGVIDPPLLASLGVTA